MSKIKLGTTKEDTRLVMEISKKIIESALIAGTISLSDFSNKDLLKKKLLKTLPKKDEDLYFVITHEETLLKEGQKYLENKEYLLSNMFYATYFEHFINDILDIYRIKNSIPHKKFFELIKSINLENKYNVILDIFKIPKFNEKHWKVIKECTERRNNFVHYKYTPESSTINDENTEKEWGDFHKKILQTIKYTKNYKSRIIYKGKKKKLNT